MFNNEEVMNALEKGEIDMNQALKKALKDLTGDRATDGNGLAIGTVIAIRYPDPENKGEYITRVQSSGYRDWDNRERVECSDTFRIYSVTKTFTATLIRQLCAEGKLRLDDNLSDWIEKISQENNLDGNPELNKSLEHLNIDPDGNATIKDLLMHTSGIGNYSQGDFSKDANSAPDEQWSVYDLFEYNEVKSSGAEKNDEYGTFCYSDTGYNLLQLIIEHATGKSYEACAWELCASKNLHHTRFVHEIEGAEAKEEAHLAHGYVINPTAGEPTSSMRYNTSHAAGGLLSTAGDMLAWAPVFYGTNSDMLDDTVLIEGIAPSRCDKKARYGYGMMVQETPEGKKSYGHGGYARGGRSKVLYYPESDTSIVTLESFENITPGIAKEIAAKEHPLFADNRKTIVLLRDAYTDAEGRFNRNQLLSDWNSDKNVVMEKIFTMASHSKGRFNALDRATTRSPAETKDPLKTYVEQMGAQRGYARSE